jgi:hypothetical protein
MKECDKPNSHISSKLHMIYISSNNVRHHVTSCHSPRPKVLPHATVKFITHEGELPERYSNVTELTLTASPHNCNYVNSIHLP